MKRAAPLLLLALGGRAASQQAPHLVISPAVRTVAAGDSVQYAARLVDASGAAVGFNISSGRGPKKHLSSVSNRSLIVKGLRRAEFKM